MIATWRFVVGIIVLHKLRCVLRQRIDHTACQSIGTVFVIYSALCIHGFFLLIACLLRILSIKISVGSYTGHVVHGHGRGSFDAGINGSGIDRHTAPATDTDDTDALRVNILLHGEEVYRCAEILGVDVRRCYIARHTAALAGVGRVKGNRQEAKLCHFLRIQTGGLLLYRTERTADGNGGQLALCALRRVHIRRQRDAVAVVKGYFLVIHLVAFREHLVPFLCQIQFFHIQTSLPVALRYTVLSTASNHSLEVSSPGTSTAR